MTTEIVMKAVSEFCNDDNIKDPQVLLIVRQILGNGKIISKIDDRYDSLLNDRFMSAQCFIDMLRLIPEILLILNKTVETVKSIKCSNLKYILYAILYRYIITNEPGFLYENNELAIRKMYSSAYSLVEIVPDTIKLVKHISSSCCVKTRKITEPISE